MTRRELPFLLLMGMVLALSRGPSHARACGGPSVADLGALRPVDGTVGRMRYPDDWSSWGNAEREAFRFLYPYWDDDPAGMDVLWRFSHEGLSSVAAPSTQVLDDVIAVGDWSAASTAARDVVDAVLELPPVLAAEHRAVLDRAVEVLELEQELRKVPLRTARDYLAGLNPVSWPPVLSRADEARSAPSAATMAGHPREATLGWLAMKRDFAMTVPDGWSDAIRTQVPRATWNRLLADTEAWLVKNVTHPLRDVVVLHQVRIHYFAGTTDDAWTTLVDLLARRPVRALAEMRYLLVMGHPPSDAQIDALTDPMLITALAAPERVDAARWRRWWKLSETSPADSWSQHLQERLLLAAAVNGAPLSPSFPGLRKPPTALWGKLRAAALLKAGHAKAANAQLALVPSDAEQARLSAHAWLNRKRLVDAASLHALDEDTRRYVIEVLMSDAELSQLAKSKATAAAEHARRELGVRATATGRWEAAAKLIEQDDAARAALWRQAHTLVAEPVRLARLLGEHRGIFYDVDYGWYRGLSYRSEELRTSSKRVEGRRLSQHLTRSSANWRALVLLLGWLEKHQDDEQAMSVLREADAHYNRLINQGGGEYFFWSAHAKTAPEIAALRRVGKAIRARQP